MPIAQARRLCPHATVVPPDHSAYHAMSRAIFGVLAGFSPVLEEVSVDEAFLDISGLRLLFPTPAAVAERIRDEVRNTVGLPCSVGVAATKLVAKMASRDAKPDGTLVVAAGTERTYLAVKPVRSLWGVGEATHARLEELGVVTIGDLAEVPRSLLVRRLGNALGGMLSDLASGIDERTVEPAGPARTISVEETYDVDLDEPARMDREPLGQADKAQFPAPAGGSGRLDGASQGSLRRFHDRDAQSYLQRAGGHRPGACIGRPLGSSEGPMRRGGRCVCSVSGSVGSSPPPLRGNSTLQHGRGTTSNAVAGVRDRFGHEAVERARLVDTAEEPRHSPEPE